jgi:hypothetical protein
VRDIFRSQAQIALAKGVVEGMNRDPVGWSLACEILDLFQLPGAQRFGSLPPSKDPPIVQAQKKFDSAALRNPMPLAFPLGRTPDRHHVPPLQDGRVVRDGLVLAHLWALFAFGAWRRIYVCSACQNWTFTRGDKPRKFCSKQCAATWFNHRRSRARAARRAANAVRTPTPTTGAPTL